MSNFELFPWFYSRIKTLHLLFSGTCSFFPSKYTVYVDMCHFNASCSINFNRIPEKEYFPLVLRSPWFLSLLHVKQDLNKALLNLKQILNISPATGEARSNPRDNTDYLKLSLNTTLPDCEKWSLLMWHKNPRLALTLLPRMKEGKENVISRPVFISSLHHQRDENCLQTRTLNMNQNKQGKK